MINPPPKPRQYGRTGKGGRGVERPETSIRELKILQEIGDKQGDQKRLSEAGKEGEGKPKREQSPLFKDKCEITHGMITGIV